MLGLHRLHAILVQLRTRPCPCSVKTEDSFSRLVVQKDMLGESFPPSGPNVQSILQACLWALGTSGAMDRRAGRGRWPSDGVPVILRGIGGEWATGKSRLRCLTATDPIMRAAKRRLSPLEGLDKLSTGRIPAVHLSPLRLLLPDSSFYEGEEGKSGAGRRESLGNSSSDSRERSVKEIGR